MKNSTIALFGESEKGDYHKPYHCKSTEQLLCLLGHPPKDSRGIYYAIQVLLFERDLLYLRVKEEGFSYDDYLIGLRLLLDPSQIDSQTTVSALCLPGVGDKEIIQATSPICNTHHSVLLINEPDLYDYLTEMVT